MHSAATGAASMCRLFRIHFVRQFLIQAALPHVLIGVTILCTMRHPLCGGIIWGATISAESLCSAANMRNVDTWRFDLVGGLSLGKHCFHVCCCALFIIAIDIRPFASR